MNDKELMKYLLEEEHHAFVGWDFSHLKGRWDNEFIPWNYKEIVNKYLNDSMNMLDMGTGGGEFLLTLNHPYIKTAVTEAYPPNIKICEEKLSPLGITVYPVKEDNKLINILDNQFDIVINRHESYSETEVKRVLKANGIFITQQVGAYNNKDLATFFDPKHTNQFPQMTLKKSIKRLEEAGFEVIYKEESYPKIHFYDLGAVAFFAKIIEWEFLNFSVKESFDKFKTLQNELNEKGYIESTEHRFIIVAINRKLK